MQILDLLFVVRKNKESNMALTPCKECGGEISSSAKACPKCGAKVSKTKWWLWVPLSLVIAFLSFGAIVSNSPEAREKARARSSIDICWEEQKRKSFDAGTKRFIAGTCELMETEFTKKYGVRP